MKLFFKRRSIKKLSGLFSSCLNRPVFLKLVLLSLVLGFTFYFKVWAGRQQEEEVPLPLSAATTAPFPSTDGPGPDPVFSDSIDVNTASQKELESLPGIGPQLAEEIVQDRLKNGPFLQAQDLLRVKGIGPQKARRIESHLRFKVN
jgi:competence ComEA-like helix-hairpin-helix protein